MSTTPQLERTEAERLRAAVTRLNRRLRTRSLGDTTPAQASALAMLERMGSPAIGELAAAEQVQPPTMTRLIDSLGARGLVERRIDALDRRCQRVELTAAGRRELSRIRSEKTAYLEQRLGALDDRDVERLRDALEVLERLAEDR